MQRWTALVFALLMATFIAVVVAVRPGAPPDKVASAVDAGADAARAADSAVTVGTSDASAPSDAGAASDDAGGEDPANPGEAAGSTTDAGATLLNGEVPPALAAESPKSVAFGVILVIYKGAQGAPPTARSRDEALELAKTLATEAKQDFKAALAKGDKGSIENAGRIPRGVLEPAPEYVLFSLPKDGVSDPVDTPRGFWIARRID